MHLERQRRRRLKTSPALLAVLALTISPHPVASTDSVLEPIRLHGAGREIIVDTDMGMDDVRAVFALLAAGEIDIRAILTVEGSASAGAGTDNLIGLLESVRRDDIPVYRGLPNPRLDPPPWRKAANTLGGNTFPPPRHTASRRVTPAVLDSLLETDQGTLHYLALGPLGNLALLAQRDREALSKIAVLWIPAKVSDEGAIEGWNLKWDKQAAGSVFREARSIVLVDLRGAGAVDAEAVLSRVSGPSRAAEWISSGVSASTGPRAHFFLHDELAVAAMVEEDLAALEETSYRAVPSANGGITLQPHRGGNIRIARLTDLERAIHLLESLWEMRIQPEEAHDGEDRMHGMEHGEGEHPAIPTETLLKTFHGHLGPYVVLGYRMGKLALETAGSTGHFGISADVYSILVPPPSCLIDGVQLGSGCTLGKRNIAVHETGGPAYAVFTTSDGVRIRIALKRGIPDTVERLVAENGVEAAGRELLRIKIEELFETKIMEPIREER
jgi:formylmethanofuran dehydrogenase subunit E